MQNISLPMAGSLLLACLTQPDVLSWLCSTSSLAPPCFLLDLTLAAIPVVVCQALRLAHTETSS